MKNLSGSAAQRRIRLIYLVTLCKRTLDQEEREEKFYQQFHQGEAITTVTDLFLQNHEVPQAQAKTVATFYVLSFYREKLTMIAPVLNKEMDDIKEVIMRSNSESYQKNLQFLKEQSKNSLCLLPT